MATCAKPVVRDGQVEDQAPAARLVPKLVADLHVAAPLARAGRDPVLRAHRVSGRLQPHAAPPLDHHSSLTHSIVTSPSPRTDAAHADHLLLITSALSSGGIFSQILFALLMLAGVHRGSKPPAPPTATRGQSV